MWRCLVRTFPSCVSIMQISCNILCFEKILFKSVWIIFIVQFSSCSKEDANLQQCYYERVFFSRNWWKSNIIIIRKEKHTSESQILCQLIVWSILYVQRNFHQSWKWKQCVKHRSHKLCRTFEYLTSCVNI